MNIPAIELHVKKAVINIKLRINLMIFHIKKITVQPELVLSKGLSSIAYR